MPLLIQIQAEDLREFLTIPITADGKRGPITISHPVNLIAHLSGLIRRLLWGIEMMETNATAGATFGLPVEVHMACQMTLVRHDDCVSVLEAVAKHAPIDVARVVPIYPPPAYTVQIIDEWRVLGQNRSVAYDRTRIALFEAMKEHDLIPLRPLPPHEQVKLLSARIRQLSEC